MEAVPRKKRLRASVVCSNCKKRKIKCDRGKPACGNCVKSNVSNFCFYEAPHWINDVETSKERLVWSEQNASTRNLSSDFCKNSDMCDLSSQSCSTGTLSLEDLNLQNHILKQEILDLRQELGRYKFKDLSYSMHHEEHSDINNVPTVQFHASYNSIITRKYCLEDCKPFSDTALMIKDIYTRLFFVTSIFSFRPAKDVLTKMSDDSGEFKGQLFMKYLFWDPEFVKIITSEKIKKGSPIFRMIESLKEEREECQTFRSIYIHQLFSLSMMTLESDDEKRLFIHLKHKIETILPSKTVIQSYLSYFLENIYPVVPFIDCQEFTGKIDNLLISRNDNACELNMTDWHELPILGTLLVLLRMSYVSQDLDLELSPMNKQILFKHPIKLLFIIKAHECMNHFNAIKRMNEDVLICLMYMKFHFIYAPEESDLLGSNLTDLLLATVTNASMNIGLYKDPIYYNQFLSNNTMINKRRKLWYGMLSIDRVQSSLKGSFPLIDRKFMIYNEFNWEREKNTKGDQTDYNIDDVIFANMKDTVQIYKLLSNLDILSYNISKPMKITEIEENIDQLMEFLSATYPLETMNKVTAEMKLVDPFQAKSLLLKNFLTLKLHFIVKLFILAIYHSLAINFEYDLANLDSKNFKKYIHKIVGLGSHLGNIWKRAINGEYNIYVGSKMKYFLNRYLQITTTRLSHVLISAILRFYHTVKILEKRKENNFMGCEVDAQIDGRLSHLQFFLTECFNIFEVIIALNKKNLTEKYYSSFKTNLFFEHTFRVLRKQGIGYIDEFFQKKCGDLQSFQKFKEFSQENLGLVIPDNPIEELNKKNLFIYLNEYDAAEMRKFFDTHECRDPQLLPWNYFGHNPTLSVFVNSNMKQTNQNHTLHHNKAENKNNDCPYIIDIDQIDLQSLTEKFDIIGQFKRTSLSSVLTGNYEWLDSIDFSAPNLSVDGNTEETTASTLMDCKVSPTSLPIHRQEMSQQIPTQVQTHGVQHSVPVSTAPSDYITQPIAMYESPHISLDSILNTSNTTNPTSANQMRETHRFSDQSNYRSNLYTITSESSNQYHTSY